MLDLLVNPFINLLFRCGRCLDCLWRRRTTHLFCQRCIAAFERRRAG